MFKDCKSGGYNLEDSKASVERLRNLVLLMEIAYTLVLDCKAKLLSPRDSRDI
jgi:hypothetical protein